MRDRPGISNFKREAARRLRLRSTPAETVLWRRLKQLDMRGSHFRRQMPIGPYIVDFACPAAHFIVEVDGSQHGSASGTVRDDQRTAWLNAAGYRVVRFWNNDVSRNIDAVKEAIYAELYGASHAEMNVLKHQRARPDFRKLTPPRRTSSADPPPPGEGEEA